MERKKSAPDREKGIRSFKTWDDNPFLTKLTRQPNQDEIVLEKKKRVSRWLRQEGIAEVSVACVRTEEELKDKYFEAVQEFFSLSGNAKEVLRYLDHIANYKLFKAEIEFKGAMSFTGYTSAQSIFNGISELLEAGLIARCGQKNSYFLSPIVFSKEKEFIVKTINQK